MNDLDIPFDHLTRPTSHASGVVHDVWRWMRTHESVHWHEPGEFPGFWSLTRYADIRTVYQEPATFSSAAGVLLRPATSGNDPGSGLTLALTDPPRHRYLRAAIADRFGERCARVLGDEMRAEVAAVVHRATELGTCDVVEDVGARLSTFTIARLMGVPEADREVFLKWTVEAFTTGRSLTTHRKLMDYLAKLMYDRMVTDADDLMGRLVNRSIEGELLSETEVLLNCENLIGAAENAGLSIAGGIVALARHPDEWRRLQQRRVHIPDAVEEILRWTSSATHSMRTAVRDAEIGGRRIKVGDRVVLWLPSANRDDGKFDAPETFDLGRRPNQHLALGAGPHVCIGGTMARHQMRMLFTELLDSVRGIELAGPVRPIRSITVGGAAHAPVRWVLH
ncbi:cytochrome P450 [Amycolatopsis sp. NPDC051102]|uniref:cytochrome P450 n=1 Tax=Amycolatopsis sp. NPDC051102 TaxID=3155163 RepID=UPI003440AAD6